MDKNELCEKLFALREKLKIQDAKKGKNSKICSDDVLRAIAQEAPKHKKDLLNISGIGQAFFENYADFFIQVLNEYHSSNKTTKELKKQVRATLKNLENRLVNISKKNRLLYMGKIYNRYAFDMFCENEEFNKKVVEFLMGKKLSLNICDANSKQKEKILKKINPLLREISKESRESGQFDLFVGYPFVVGKTRGEDFNVRAPLVLFPITFEKRESDIILKIDKQKDILFNTTLILMQNKFLQKNEDIPNNVVENFCAESFLSDIKSFYKQYEINLKIYQDFDTCLPFKDILQNEFPKFDAGEFYIMPNAVLGKFSLYSNALERDFKTMTESIEVNALVDDLLCGFEESDFYTSENILEEEKQSQYIDVDEKNINYINDLNSSQEQAVLNATKNNKLVIQGPPGTGKSQAITSMITDAVNKGLGVVMVSQKKAALDVIHSRLGELNKFAILLSDVKDKANFYKQMEQLTSQNKAMQIDQKSFEEIADEIEYNISDLNTIGQKIYSQDVAGTKMFKIYQESTNNIFKKSKEFEDLFYNFSSAELFKIPYDELKKIKEKFDSKSLIEKLFDYLKTTQDLPEILNIKTNLSIFEEKNMQKEFVLFEEEQKQFFAQNFFKKIVQKQKRKKELVSLLKKYFNSKSAKKEFFKNPQKLVLCAKNLEKFKNTKIDYDSLNSNEILFLSTMFKIQKINGTIDVCQYLFDFVVYYIILEFENKNREMFTNIKTFSNIEKQIDKEMAQKKDITKNKTKNLLFDSYYKNIFLSKRYSEISRQIQSSRHPSIQKFIKKFDYELFKGIKIWLMTPEAVSEILPLEYDLFDLLIFDEASQIYIERGIPAIARAKKVVVAGDHKQLRPSNLGFGRIDFDDEESEEIEDDVDAFSNAALEEESLLDLARFKYPSVLLNYHYRAKFDELINFSNYAFYGGKLNVSPNVLKTQKPPIEFIKINNGLWKDRRNKEEAKKIVEVVKNIFENRKNNETFGVITFNIGQRDAILDEIDEECLRDKNFALQYQKESNRKEKGEDVGFFVKNIENVQGDERDVIIFSVGYAKNKEGKVVRNFGWLNQKGGENRLNVAISRAKQKIYLVSSIFPEELVVDDLKHDGPKLFRKYLEYCLQISNQNYESANNLLLSLGKEEEKGVSENLSEFEKQVVVELEKNGLKIQTKIGVGKYKIDIAIFDDKSKKYLLGIECDNNPYQSQMKTRERDVFKQKYFESRGWKMHRIFSVNWWHNQQKEIDRILKMIKE